MTIVCEIREIIERISHKTQKPWFTLSLKVKGEDGLITSRLYPKQSSKDLKVGQTISFVVREIGVDGFIRPE
jgi:hypothetical protein